MKNAATYWEGNPYKRPRSPFWHIVFDDASGRQRRESTKTKDLKIAREILAEKLRAVEKQRAGHVDRYAESRNRRLEEFVVLYTKDLTAKKAVPKYIKETARQLRQFVEFASVATIQDIRLADAERFLTGLRTAKSAKTRDGYAGSLRAFGRWLHSTGRWDCDPLAGVRLKTAKRDKDRVFKRVGLRYEEAERLVEGAMARFLAEQRKGGQPTHDEHETGDTVRDRQALYWFVLTTAFRAKECSSLRWEDLTLNGDRLAVRLSGKFTKNGDDAIIPMQKFVAEALKEMRRRRSEQRMLGGTGPVQETDHVFHVPDKIARLVRKDAQHAGLIPQRSPSARRVDFHALRKSCARILIELNVHPKIIQQVLRHSDIRLTMDLYGELGEDDLFRELPGKFPVPALYRGVCTTVCTDADHEGASPGTKGHDAAVTQVATGPEVLHG